MEQSLYFLQTLAVSISSASGWIVMSLQWMLQAGGNVHNRSEYPSIAHFGADPQVSPAYEASQPRHAAMQLTNSNAPKYIRTCLPDQQLLVKACIENQLPDC